MAVGTLSSNAKGIVPVGHASSGSGTVPTLEGREGASQTFIAGAPLKLSSGLLIEATADDIAGIVGVAAEPASGTTSALLRYYPAGQDVIWEATLEDQTNEDHALVVANIGGSFALQTDTPGNWYLDENDTTNVAAMVIAPRDWQDVTDATVRARVKFVFLNSAIAWGTTDTDT